MRRGWALVVLGLGACQAPPQPTLEQIYQGASHELETGDLRQAQAHAEQGERLALEAGDPGAAWSFTVLRALVLTRKRDRKGALELLRAPPPPEAAPVDRVRAQMGRGYASCLEATVGDADRSGLGPAQADLTRALGDAKALHQAELQGDILVRQALCHTLADEHDAAQATYLEALAFARTSGLSRHEAKLAADLGLLRQRQRRWDDAADWFDRSLEISAQLDVQSLSASVLGNLGWAYSELGDVDRALPVLLRSKELADAAGLTQEAETAAAHLGDVFLQRGDLTLARRHYEEALRRARELQFPGDERWLLQVLQLVALRQGRLDDAESFASQGRALEANGDSRQEPVPFLTEAEVSVERQDLDRAAGLYERIIAAPETSADTRWRAFFGLARLARTRGDLPEAARRYRQASRGIEQMRKELAEETYEFLLFSSLRRFHESYVSFLVECGNAEEALRVAEHGRGRVMWERLKAPGAEPGAGSFVRLARAYRAVLLAYWLGEEHSYLWAVTSRGVSVRVLPARAAIASAVERYQAMLQRSRDPLEGAADETAALYETLVGPVAASIPRGSRVVVLPDGPLHQLAFDALLVPRPSPHFWVEDVVLVRTPSLLVLAAEQDARRRGGRRVLVIGDPEPASDEFPPLPNVGDEVRQVQRHFPQADRVALTGEAAHPLAYREAGPERFGIVHFAAHATANPDRPLDSAVVLSRRGLDFKLYAREIVEVPTRAELVTLSACRGAGARVYAGEGLVGFAWAFLSAGARHVVAGLWDVEDASTAQLMDRMYEGLARGEAPPEALREAKLALLRSPTAFRKPYYWAPFVVYTQRQGRAGGVPGH